MEMLRSFACALILLLLMSTARADDEKRAFSIPPGPAGKSLLVFLQQCGSDCEMLFSSSDVEAIDTPAVQGEMTIREAIKKLLAGAPLDVKFDKHDRYISVQRQRVALPPEKVPKQSTRSRRTPPASGLQEVTVTGTQNHGLQSVSPPQKTERTDERNRTGYATVQDLVQAMPIVSRAGPNEHFMSAGNFSRGVGANLRGLGANATLVLVNGHRQASSGVDGDFVDISEIPWSAVERVEVLPDGASAIYGADAIAGVLNIIMRDEPDLCETTARVASDHATESFASQLCSRRWTSGRAFISYQYAARGTLAASERDYAMSSDKRAIGGSDFRSVRSAPPNVLNPATLLPAYAVDAKGDLIPGVANLGDRMTDVDILPRRQTHSAFLSFSQQMAETTEIFVESRLSTRKIWQRASPADTLVAVPNSNPFVKNPFPGTPSTLIAYSYAQDLGPIILDANVVGTNSTAGVRHRIADSWRAEFNVTRGTERTKWSALNQVDQQAQAIALADPNPATAFNPFSPGTTNPATIERLRLIDHQDVRSGLSDVNLVVDGTLIPAWDVRLAAGGSWRRETLARTLPVPGAFERTVRGAFAELAIPLVDRDDGGPAIELSVAERIERYSDFGYSSNPKIGLRWSPIKALNLRASWGTSFRAPNIGDASTNGYHFTIAGLMDDPKSPSGRSAVLNFIGSNPNLHQEEAATWTAGLEYLPSANFRAAIDYHSIDFRNRIVQPGTPTPPAILRDEALWSSFIHRNPSSAEVEAICARPDLLGITAAQCMATPFAAIVDTRVSNTARTQVRVIDFAMENRLESPIGRFSASLRGTYMLDFQQRASPASPWSDVVDTVGSPLRLKTRAAVAWSRNSEGRGLWGASVALEHAGGYRDSVARRRVDAFNSVDVGLSLQSLSNLKYEVAASNLFDAPPPFIDREAGYDIANAAPFGRVWTVQVIKQW